MAAENLEKTQKKELEAQVRWWLRCWHCRGRAG